MPEVIRNYDAMFNSHLNSKLDFGATLIGNLYLLSYDKINEGKTTLHNCIKPLPRLRQIVITSIEKSVVFRWFYVFK